MTISLSPRCFALVPCAGIGSRAGTVGPKQYAKLAGSTVVGHTLAALGRVTRLQSVLGVLSSEDDEFEWQGAGCPAKPRGGHTEKLKGDVPEGFRHGGAAGGDAPMNRPPQPRMRIGEGWDIHALVEGRPLILGGVEVPHTHGLLGHSDADALCH